MSNQADYYKRQLAVAAADTGLEEERVALLEEEKQKLEKLKLKKAKEPKNAP